MELLEYVNYNFLQKNESVCLILKELILNMEKDESINESYKKAVYSAYGCAKGYTLYRLKDLANCLGVSKTAIKYMNETLINENKIELFITNEITFIKPIISTNIDCLL